MLETAKPYLEYGIQLITLIVILVTKFSDLKNLKSNFTDFKKDFKKDFEKHKTEIWEKVDNTTSKIDNLSGKCEGRHEKK
jgi:hypothetical protein